MGAIIEFMSSAMAAVLYFLALTAVLFLFNRYDELAGQVKDNINDNPAVYEQRKEVREDNTVSYQKLCTSLLGELKYDISINGQEIKAADYDYMLYDFSALRKTDYTMEYIYSKDGSILMVLYKSRQGV